MSNYPETTKQLLGLATRALTEAGNTRGWIVNLQGKREAKSANFSHKLNRPAIQPPPTFSDLFEGADTSGSEIKRLDAEEEAWLAKYFPAINGCLKTLPEEFICGVIGGTKPFGMDVTIFEMVWHQARDRAYRAQASETKNIAATFSGAGFSLPPGAMAVAVTESERRASEAIAEVNIQQAIKDAEIKLDLLKFAEQLGVDLKLGVMRAMSDFYRLWYSLPDRDIERARIRAQAMSTFYQALSSYHNVEVAFERLALEVSRTKADVSVENARLALAASSDMDANLGALGQAVSAYGDIASGAASAASTLVAQLENT
ncbi:hypothetical protein [Pseudomonas paralcaligenes]|uniref:hypothetical protein n=1 Tax=Pseudomonas paralcaligenes TaxID=2772558 RepID=UPI001C8197FF|nr:hypothetical protein [Pseudomonas paralcaligenes]